MAVALRRLSFCLKKPIRPYINGVSLSYMSSLPNRVAADKERGRATVSPVI
uniref:Uncharacterized protein MANES_18G055500 n=1 Tax=Rhizophora mucronata TaxID=61149 RepID=A0A2P2KFK9_RHIMU